MKWRKGQKNDKEYSTEEQKKVETTKVVRGQGRWVYNRSSEKRDRLRDS